MAPNYKHVEEDEDEGYIDMDLSSSSSNLFGHSINISSSPQDIDFEFFFNDQESDEATVFPADEHFYKGKLLPLHLPPRLQMLRNLLQQSTASTSSLAQSCDVSPSESFRSTCDKQLNDHFFDGLSADKFIVGDIPKKSWHKKKLRLIKKLLAGQNIMACRAHLKSLFLKSSCSDKYTAKEAADKGDAGNISKGDTEHSSTKAKTSKKISGRWPIRQDDPFNISHRRSFQGEIKQHSVVKRSYSPSLSSSCSSCSSSSSFSFDTNGVCGQDLQRRRSSSGSDTEGSIDAAIAHCKKSQQY